MSGSWKASAGESMWFQELDVLFLLGSLIVLSALSVCLLVGKTRVKDGKVERDFWTGTRGAARFPSPWTGETIFYQKLDQPSFGKEKVCETA